MDLRHYLTVALVLTQVVSFVACWWLLLVLRRRILPYCGRRLFPRMLRSLAIFALLAMVAGIPISLLDLLGFPEFLSTSERARFCRYSYDVLRPLRYAVVLQEAHMGLVFLAESTRCVRILQALNHGIPAVLALALLLGVLDEVFFPWTYTRKHDKCFLDEDKVESGIDVLQLSVLVSGMGSSSLALLATLLRSLLAVEPSGVQRRNFLRASGYPVITTVTLPLMMVVYRYRGLSEEPAWFLPLAMILECCTGFFIAVLFWSQSYCAARSQAAAERLARTTATSLMTTTTPPAADDPKSFASFGVTFGGVDVWDVIPYKNDPDQDPDTTARRVKARRTNSPQRLIERRDRGRNGGDILNTSLSDLGW